MKALRTGFTTGACAAACALASCLWRQGGACPERVRLPLPEGGEYAPAIRPLGPYRCAVTKDAGDDPDVTDGCEVWAEVTPGAGDGEIAFRAGEGVGTVTLPGLSLPVGEPAINPGPRAMIGRAVRAVLGPRSAEVTVGITGGRALAGRTFNPRLGIEGGLSVLGTTGVERPMSEEALRESIRLELSVRRAAGNEDVALVFGRQGEEALRRLCPGRAAVQMSNWVGFALEAARELGFSRALLAGQPGKLVKVSGGSLQTHSRASDGRRETLLAHLALMGAPQDLLRQTMETVTLEGIIPAVREAGYAAVWDRLCDAAAGYASARVRGEMAVSALMLDREGQVLGRSRGCPV